MPPTRNQSIPMSRRRSPYSTRKELELNSPSRRDGITFVEESNLRSLYCSHIEKAGQDLKLSPFTIATALMLCHRFYSRQSHAKNCWRTVASSCVLLASKVQDEPRFVNDVVHVVYDENEIQKAITDMMKRKKLNPNDKREREVFSKTRGEIMRREKKELILKAEMIVLKTIGLNLNPYEALAVALNRFKSDKITELSHLTWNLIEKWLIKTSLCLQYEPQYITVGSVLVAAMILKLKPPAGEKWLEEFDVSPEKLDEVIQQMQSYIYNLNTNETIRIFSFYEIVTHTS